MPRLVSPVDSLLLQKYVTPTVAGNTQEYQQIMYVKSICNTGPAMSNVFSRDVLRP